MPMQEVRYKSNAIPHYCAEEICAQLDSILRDAIKEVLPDRDNNSYGVFVRGDPFGSISHNEPDFSNYVFYHSEWEFTKTERETLEKFMDTAVQTILEDAGLTGRVVVHRFYRRVRDLDN